MHSHTSHMYLHTHDTHSRINHTSTLTHLTQALIHPSNMCPHIPITHVPSHTHHTCVLTHPVLPFSKEVGCYVDEEDKHAFMFSQEGKLTFVSGDQASTQATVSLDHVLCRIQVAGVES